jgi:hypothetical protein
MSELNTSYDNNMADQIDPPKKSNRTFKPTHLATKQGRSGMSGVYGATSTALLGVNTGLGNSTYDKNLSWFGDVDQKDVQGSINEHRYEQQGWGTQLAAGVGRAATKALSEVAKLPFVVGGAIAAPFVEDGQGYDTVFNNQFIKSIDSINEEINTEMLPVYVGKAIKDGNLWDAVTSTSFWATDGADGLGFLIENPC